MEIDILATLVENFEKCAPPPPPLTSSWIRACFELIISLLALHVKDFISTCMNNLNNDHR